MCHCSTRIKHQVFFGACAIYTERKKFPSKFLNNLVVFHSQLLRWRASFVIIIWHSQSSASNMRMRSSANICLNLGKEPFVKKLVGTLGSSGFYQSQNIWRAPTGGQFSSCHSYIICSGNYTFGEEIWYKAREESRRFNGTYPKSSQGLHNKSYGVWTENEYRACKSASRSWRVNSLLSLT